MGIWPGEAKMKNTTIHTICEHYSSTNVEVAVGWVN